MSTPNPTHIIAEHRAQLVHAHAHSLISVGSTMNLECLCGGFATAGPYSVDEMYALHSEHVVSKLTDAGYSIVHHRSTCSESGDRCRHLPNCVVAVCICGDDWPCPILAAAAEGEKP